MRNSEVICQNYGVYFEVDTGYCSYGPCKGTMFNDLDTTIDGDHVFLSDDKFDCIERGEIETNPANRSPSSNVKL